jgi:hypothetical protein
MPHYSEESRKRLNEERVRIDGKVVHYTMACGRTTTFDIDDLWVIDTYYLSSTTEKGEMYYVYASAKCKKYRSHRLLLDAPKGIMVDHKDGNTLNNCRNNLRLVTRSQNTWNSEGHGELKKSKLPKGVFWDCTKNIYKAIIGYNGKRIYIGGFHNPEDAAEAYRQKSIELHGEFSVFERDIR